VFSHSIQGTAFGYNWLAFIFYYTKVHRVAPAETDMQRYFGVTPPSVHQMVLTLEANGFIERVPGTARSIHLLIPRERPTGKMSVHKAVLRGF
jgi:hypothetical protein